MPSKFEISDLGKLTYYFSIEFHQGDNGIELKQEAYARKVLKEVGLETCNPTKIPMEFGLKVSKPEEEEEIDAIGYRRNVGCLRYLLIYSISMLSLISACSQQRETSSAERGIMTWCLRKKITLNDSVYVGHHIFLWALGIVLSLSLNQRLKKYLISDIKLRRFD